MLLLFLLSQCGDEMSETICEFKCLGADCPNHCCGAYSGGSSALHPLGSIGFSEIILLPEDVERLKNAGYEHLIRTNSEGIATIHTASDGTCAALKDGRCNIYDARPAICRAYPLYLDMFTGACTLNECKAVPPDLQLCNCKEALYSLFDIYQFWIDYYRNKME